MLSNLFDCAGKWKYILGAMRGFVDMHYLLEVWRTF